MMRRTATVLATGAAVALLGAGPALASTATPAEETAQAPAPGAAAYHSTWTGTVPVGAQPQDAAADSCMTQGVLDDTHLVHYKSPIDTASSTTLTFTIAWVPVTPDGGDNGVTSSAPASDMEIAVRDAAGNVVAEDDTNANKEQVVVNDLPSGDYTVLACGFLNAAPQPYTGSLDIATVAKSAPPAPVFEDGTAGSGGPGTDVPEAPIAVLLPLAALAVGGWLLWRRRGA